jgi:hypothetical protein
MNRVAPLVGESAAEGEGEGESAGEGGGREKKPKGAPPAQRSGASQPGAQGRRLVTPDDPRLVYCRSDLDNCHPGRPPFSLLQVRY